MKLTNEICISFLRGSGWLYNHDKEITNSEYNKSLDDFVNACKEYISCQTFGLHINGIERIAEQLKVCEQNDR